MVIGYTGVLRCLISSGKGAINTGQGAKTCILHKVIGQIPSKLAKEYRPGCATWGIVTNDSKTGVQEIAPDSAANEETMRCAFKVEHACKVNSAAALARTDHSGALSRI